MSEPSAFDRLHHSRAGGPTPADVDAYAAAHQETP